MGETGRGEKKKIRTEKQRMDKPDTGQLSGEHKQGCVENRTFIAPEINRETNADSVFSVFFQEVEDCSACR
ncbi:MAG: hypothetical protein D3906_00075 [Candidatus Electrothrix sp. AUS1_2]|nr:hypothetical protein [Candidatus Electrothrix sp. AUS1_2]